MCGVFPLLTSAQLAAPWRRHPAALPATLTKLSLWAPHSPNAQRPHPPLGGPLRHLARLKCLWLGGWRVSHADLPPSLQLLKLQVRWWQQEAARPCRRAWQHSSCKGFQLGGP